MDKKYFVIEKNKYSYPDEHFKYSIMKSKLFDLKTATKMLVAYEQLNDDKDKSFYIQNVDLFMGNNEEPLRLTELLTEDMEVNDRSN
tara:strand:+ start:174 stop:434 length:261 start_codon:yes stop_codon:yes gene_type:complete